MVNATPAPEGEVASLMAKKEDLRLSMLARRQELREHSQAPEREARFNERLAAFLAEPEALHVRGDFSAPISAYLPIGSEISPLPAMERLAQLGRSICVPVMQGRGKPLRFRAWHPEVPLARGPFGVMEPASGPWQTPALLLVPLLAFDGRGHRLGYGGGFYDRTLAALRERQPVLAIGLAWAGQEVEEVPTEPTDAPLDGIFTEEGYRPFSPAAIALHRALP